MNIKIFIRNLEAIMELKKIKPIDLSRKTGISRGYISLIMSGKKQNISNRNLNKIAIALDILPDHIVKLADPDFDPESFIKKEKQSIIVPFIFKFSMLRPDMIESLRSMDLGKRTIPEKRFISFPRCEPFILMNGQSYISSVVDIDTGMAPKVETGDVITINLEDTKPREKGIYLILIEGQFKLRYAKIQVINGKKLLRCWAEDRSLGEDIVDLDSYKGNPIIGNVRTHTRIFQNVP
jgi:DNA-binding Xre family transcriptional regulator